MTKADIVAKNFRKIRSWKGDVQATVEFMNEVKIH
jgi:hypothetical protein